MDLQLQGRVAAVAAASAGLGFASAYTLAQEGCQVAICARDEARLDAAARKIRTETGAEVMTVPIDMGDRSGPVSFIARAAEYFGRLDIAVANAGDPPGGGFEAVVEEDWEFVFQLTLQSTIRLFRAALPHVRQSDQGRLLAITSTSAREPSANRILSSSLRAGVHGTIKTLSREIASEGVTVNAVCPGYIDTGLVAELAQQEAEQSGMTRDGVYAQWAAPIPLGRLGEPGEVGAAVAFLCSRQAAFISGIALSVDGGMLQGLP